MKQKKLRRLLLFLPVPVYPSFCLLFFVFHSVSTANGKIVLQQDGINKLVPEAAVEAPPTTKMSLYDRARGDSEKLTLSARQDGRAFNLDLSGGDLRRPDTSLPDLVAPPVFMQTPAGGQGRHGDAATHAQEQLAALQKQVEMASSEAAAPREDPAASAGESEQVTRLQKMMEDVSAGKDQPDSELLLMNGMLNKILQIQHPELVMGQDTGYGAARRRLAQRVSRLLREDFDQPQAADSLAGLLAANRFYDLDHEEVTLTGNAFSAMVAAGGSVMDGSPLSLILTEDMVVSGHVIAKGKTLTGTCTIGTQRIYVTVTSILDGKTTLPVNLVAYGLDGQPGIPSPEAVSSETLKNGTGSMISGMDINSMDPSLGAQAANAGIQTAKALLSKKVKTIKVKVRAQDQLLLVDASTKN